MAAIVIFAGVLVAQNWSGVLEGMRRLDAGSVLGATALVLAGLLAAMQSWRVLLAGLGSPLPLRAAARVFFLSQLGKYIPGSVWPVVAQAELSRDYTVPPARAAFTALAQMLVSLITGIATACVALSISLPDALSRYWWLFAAGLVGAVTLLPAVFNWLVGLTVRLLRRRLRVERVSGRTMAAAAGWCLVMWLAFGAHLWLLARPLDDGTPGLPMLALGAYALAWAVGFVIVILPAGAGAREAALVLVLGHAVGADDALALGLVSRFVMLVGDFATAGAAVLAERSRRQRAPSQAKSTETDPATGTITSHEGE